MTLSCRKKRRHAASDVLSTEGLVDNIQRVHCSEISVEEFASKFELSKTPVIIQGLCDAWEARKLWSEEELLRCYSEHRFKVKLLKVLSIWSLAAALKLSPAVRSFTLL